MNPQPVRVLLVDEDPADMQLIRSFLADPQEMTCDLQTAANLAGGLDHLERAGADVLLLSLSLPDGRGLEALDRVRAKMPLAPVVALLGADDEALGREAVARGAQDYLLRGQFDHRMLARVLHYAVEHQRLQADLALADPLTGLYNRRIFLILAEQYLRLAKRVQHGLVLVALALDRLQEINEKHGRAEGDWALTQVAGILRSNFREADVMGRLGGDGFAFLAMGVRDKDADALAARLNEALAGLTASAARPYSLSLSAGWVWYNPEAALPLADLMAQANAALEAHQQRKRQVR